MKAHAVDYMRFRCLGNIFALSNFIFIGVFRGIKDARTPLYAVLASNVSNFAMDLLFVYGWGMGAGGAALATALSQMLSCSILVRILIKKCALPARATARSGTAVCYNKDAVCMWPPYLSLIHISEPTRPY